MKKRTPLILLFLIFFIGAFLRFYKLDQIPPGLNQDETAIGYNAYSILETGKDEYGEFLPIYFKSFGDHKLPAYIYFTVPSIALFGLTEFAVRFPSAMFGSLSILVLYFLVFELTGNRKLSLLSSAMLAIVPWHIHFSRAAFEVNGALFFALLGVWMFMRAVHTERKLLFMILSIITFSISLYSYNVTRLLSPLLFGILLMMNRGKLKTFSRKDILISAVLFLVCLSPFLMTFFTRSGVVSAKGALITSNDVQAEIIELRSYFISLPALFTKIFFNKYILLVWRYLQNTAGFLSTHFFFISGSPHGNQGIGNVGVLYLFSFPLIVTGIYQLFKQKAKQLYIFFFWLVGALLVASLSKEVPHATRGYFLVLPLCFFTAFGLYHASCWLVHRKERVFAYGGMAAVVALIGYSVVYFLSSYFVRFPILYNQPWRGTEKEIALFLKEHEKEYDSVVFDADAGYMYTSLLFYQQYPPAKFQDQFRRYPDDSEGFSYMQSFGEYYFEDINWDQESRKKTLFITNKQELSPNYKLVKSYYYPDKPVAYSYKENLYQMVKTEHAFSLFTIE